MLDLFEEIDMLGAKQMETTMDPNAKLVPERGQSFHNPSRC